MYKIMIVDDDPALASLLGEHLSHWGYEIAICEKLADVIGEFKREKPHLVMLDISLPFFNGHHWCAEIRRVSTAPIIFISSSGSSMDMVMAMTMGGDDYIQKPFDLDVVLAKVKALLRRTYDFTGALSTIEVRGAVLDIGQSTLYYNGERIELTRNESRILQLLLERKGSIVTRGDLMNVLWDSDCFIDDNTLTVNIARLRKRLDEIGLGGLIATRKGQGYLVGNA
ncbi:MAG: response regulator transcription factor [Eubacteriales bacterium]|nr:response regulator transcription factor [Eubacteriales bacterium]MDD3883031.1 response regulator transcription factor [Eubacteriales bacterium]MDD4513642.1 response regulator transcription factor [Eubacteriales bacterium]